MIPRRCRKDRGITVLDQKRRSSQSEPETVSAETGCAFVIGPRVELFLEPRQAVEVHVTQVTQSAPITCAQIATILKNSASEASVANSSTMVRHMSLTPTSVQEFNVFPCFGLTLEGSRFIGRAGNGNVQLRAEH